MKFSEQLYGYFAYESTQWRMTRLISYTFFLLITAADEGEAPNLSSLSSIIIHMFGI